MIDLIVSDPDIPQLQLDEFGRVKNEQKPQFLD